MEDWLTLGQLIVNICIIIFIFRTKRGYNGDPGEKGDKGDRGDLDLSAMSESQKAELLAWIKMNLYAKEFNEKDISDYPVKALAFPTENSAADTLRMMKDILEDYGFVSVSDYYDICGVPYESNDHLWIWDNLNDVAVYSCADGYFLNLPKPMREKDKDFSNEQ